MSPANLDPNPSPDPNPALIIITLYLFLIIRSGPKLIGSATLVWQMIQGICLNATNILRLSMTDLASKTK
jgi:hypothetical protein